jgi:transposase-like protein
MANRTRDEQRERDWRSVLTRFRHGGLSVREFCRREGVPESAFYFWRRTLRDRDAESRSSVPAFLPVAVRRHELDSPGAEVAVQLGAGLTIRFAEQVPAERIAALVRALQREEPQA